MQLRRRAALIRRVQERRQPRGIGRRFDDQHMPALIALEYLPVIAVLVRLVAVFGRDLIIRGFQRIGREAAALHCLLKRRELFVCLLHHFAVLRVLCREHKGQPHEIGLHRRGSGAGHADCSGPCHCNSPYG